MGTNSASTPVTVSAPRQASASISGGPGRRSIPLKVAAADQRAIKESGTRRTAPSRASCPFGCRPSVLTPRWGATATTGVRRDLRQISPAAGAAGQRKRNIHVHYLPVRRAAPLVGSQGFAERWGARRTDGTWGSHIDPEVPVIFDSSCEWGS